MFFPKFILGFAQIFLWLNFCVSDATLKETSTSIAIDRDSNCYKQTKSGTYLLELIIVKRWHMDWAFATFKGNQHAFLPEIGCIRHVKITGEYGNVSLAKVLQFLCETAFITATLWLGYVEKGLSVVVYQRLLPSGKGILTRRIGILNVFQ